MKETRNVRKWDNTPTIEKIRRKKKKKNIKNTWIEKNNLLQLINGDRSKFNKRNYFWD